MELNGIRASLFIPEVATAQGLSSVLAHLVYDDVNKALATASRLLVNFTGRKLNLLPLACPRLACFRSVWFRSVPFWPYLFRVLRPMPSSK